MKLLLLTLIFLYITMPQIAAGKKKKLKKRIEALESNFQDLSGDVDELKQTETLTDTRLNEIESIVSKLEEATCPVRQYPTNCIEVYQQDPNSVSDVYTIYTPSGDPIQVYCDFYGTRGYMFLSKAALSKLDSLDGLYTITDYAVIRVLYSNGEQHEVLMSQMKEYQFRFALSFQLSKADGYKLPVNHVMLPYMYLGFLPRDAAVLKPRFSEANPIQGYNAGGQDVTFANCDLNPNSYIAFFGNDNNIAENNYFERCCDWPRMRIWYENDKPVPHDRYIERPDDYFCFYEMHMGGCGGYFTSSHGVNYGVEGAALGLGFDIKPKC